MKYHLHLYRLVLIATTTVSLVGLYIALTFSEPATTYSSNSPTSSATATPSLPSQTSIPTDIPLIPPPISASQTPSSQRIETSASSSAPEVSTPSPTQPSQTVTIQIDDKIYPLTLSTEKNVLDALFTLEQEGKIRLKIARTAIGVLVESIDDKHNGNQGKYWFFKVNGTFASKGASHTPLRADDQVNWEFRQP